MPRIEMKMDPPAAVLKARTDKALKGLKRSWVNTSYKQAAVFLDRWVQKNFRSEGGNVGGWEPLAPATVLGRIRKNLRGGNFRGVRNVRGFGGAVPLAAARFKILQDTGRLRLSFVPFATANNAGIGSDLDYAEAHHEGLGDLPERRLLPKHSEVRNDIRKIFERNLRKGLHAMKPIGKRI